MKWPVLLILAISFFSTPLFAQGNYEIEVYGAETVPAHNTVVALHSNFTAEGQKELVDGVYPTNHQLHETIEVIQGLNEWSEVGLYVFTSSQDGRGVQWVGDHIRPRVRVPETWHWPVGVGLSAEMGYQRAVYSPNTWTLEVRPIVDKSLGRWYMAANPSFGRTWHGPEVDSGVVFSPEAKLGYAFAKEIKGGIEYYGDYGKLGSFDDLHEQKHKVFLVSDFNVAEKWELNFGVGMGSTAATDHILIKAIVARRFSWGHHQEKE